MSKAGGGYVTEPDGARVWQDAPAPEKPKRQGAATRSPGERRSPLSDEERAERAQFQRDKLEIRRREVVALEKLLDTPDLHVEGEPRVQDEKAIQLDARTAAGRELLTIARPSGSELRLSCRTYDGMQGGPPKFYALGSIWFRHSSGGKIRSKGLAIEGPELRRVGQALLALADEFDAACAAGVEPWARPDSSWKPPAGTGAPPGGEDCPDCGGELPSHLDGCDRVVPEPTTKPDSPMALLPGAARKTLRVTCDDEEEAGELTAALRRAGHAADCNGASVVARFATEGQAETLGAKLSKLGAKVERV